MLLFVYGTLRKAFAHPMAQKLSHKAKHIGFAYVYAQLFDLGEYPGIVLSTDKKSKTFGDLYQLTDLSFVKELDEYEGDEYKKKETIVYCDKRSYHAYVYELIIPHHTFEMIPSGDYIKYH